MEQIVDVQEALKIIANKHKIHLLLSNKKEDIIKFANQLIKDGE